MTLRIERPNTIGLLAFLPALLLGAVGCSEANDAAPVASTTAAPDGSAPDETAPGATVPDDDLPDVERTDPALDAIVGTDGGVDVAIVGRVLDLDLVDPGSGTPLDRLEPAAAELPEVWPLNSRREEIRLDETALLACATTQFADVALEGRATDEARSWLGVATVRASESAVADVRRRTTDLAAATLGTADAAAVVDAMLELCLERGFEF